ncbi:STAS domain-containing protein [Telmatospirillum siberiense]|uniref:STAS domain-containing protein n=1 Tax=Telmatospirillum siberiense TaxID=382514 RepID=A0A2N3PX66_9PROT|nr:STAS domain-containing protein [Telmatospirillum siberiense]PKU25000.1 hypothetical protein CWS72_09055 [Telmatospirillum siberiense]
MEADENYMEVDISGDVSFVCSADIHDRLCKALTNGRPVVVDCAGAVNIDLSFIQLLLAARLSAMRRGLPFALKRPVGEALLSALRRDGFLSETPLPNDAFWTGGV